MDAPSQKQIKPSHVRKTKSIPIPAPKSSHFRRPTPKPRELRCPHNTKSFSARTQKPSQFRPLTRKPSQSMPTLDKCQLSPPHQNPVDFDPHTKMKSISTPHKSQAHFETITELKSTSIARAEINLISTNINQVDLDFHTKTMPFSAHTQKRRQCLSRTPSQPLYV